MLLRNFGITVLETALDFEFATYVVALLISQNFSFDTTDKFRYIIAQG